MNMPCMRYSRCGRVGRVEFLHVATVDFAETTAFGFLRGMTLQMRAHETAPES